MVEGVVRWAATTLVFAMLPSGGLSASESFTSSFHPSEFIPYRDTHFQGRPEPPLPFRIRLAYPRLKIPRIIDYALEPNTNRFFAVRTVNHWSGPSEVLRVYDDPETCDFQLLIESPMLIYGIALHPNYANNRFIYLFGNERQTFGGRINRIVRYTMYPAPGDGCDLESRLVILEFPSEGHDGGGMAFGPDGMLYLATGDGSGGSDQGNKGQALNELCAKVLRIDVDHPTPDQPYSIPTDNPFLDTVGARHEVWAYGFRNPWRMTFDSETGHLWVGNNGQDLWESAYLVEKGANYGWPLVEGGHPFHPNRPQGPTPISPPTIEHPHSEARSLTGGVVYHGERLKPLQGAYVYGDFSTGKIWSMRHDEDQPTEVADAEIGIAGFANGRDDELFVLDYEGGDIYFFEPNSTQRSTDDFPTTLSQSGLFSSVPKHQLKPSMIPYSINASRWADAAIAERYIGIPPDGKIGFTRRRAWQLPEGTVILKTFFLERNRGIPASRRPIETQILTRQQGEWNGYTYRWNPEATDATLVRPEGEDATIEVADGQAANGISSQPWRFASRVECTACHNRAVEYVLGVTTPQMNRTHVYGRLSENQIRLFDQLGLFRTSPARKIDAYPRLARLDDSTETIEHRAKSYLHVNCHHCHVREGGGNARIELEYNPTSGEDETARRSRNRRRRQRSPQLIGALPDHGDFAIADAKIVSSGAPESSVLYFRMAKRGRGRMPYAGSQMIDRDGLELVYQWIASLAGDEPDKPKASAEPRTAEQWLSTTSRAIAAARRIDRDDVNPALKSDIIDLARQHPSEAVRDLFERFIPPSQRLKRLGVDFEPREVLDLTGNARRGEAVFFADGLQCKSCHRVRGRGGRIGPDLSDIGKKYNLEQLLVSITEPSNPIHPDYQTYRVATVDGEVHAGLIVSQDEEHVALRTAQNDTVRFRRTSIEEMGPQRLSLMPDSQLKDMTAQQAADLLEYLDQQE